jgi:hypothetical protein
MITDGLAGDSAPASTGGIPVPLSVPAILGICDGLLGEVGRRQHRFAWLRPPDSGSEDWLVVDAYYPGNRVLVVCRDEAAAHDHLYAELTPAHGLRLLALAPGELGDHADAILRLTRLITELGPIRRPTEQALREDAARDSAIARVAASFAHATAPANDRRPLGRGQAAAIERAARVAATRQALAGTASRPPATARPRPNPRPPAARSPIAAASVSRPSRRRDPGAGTSTMDMVVGVALAVAVCAELYLGVGRFALDGGHWLLAFGIAFDACARALGTIAAGRAGRRDWAWGCVIGGSPVVASFALFQPEGPLITEPGPIAGLVSVLAVSVIAIAVLASALRI